MDKEQKKEFLSESRDSWLESAEFYKKDALHSVYVGWASVVMALGGAYEVLAGDQKAIGMIAAIGGNVLLLVSQREVKDSIEEGMIDRARAQERQDSINHLET